MGGRVGISARWTPATAGQCQTAAATRQAGVHKVDFPGARKPAPSRARIWPHGAACVSDEKTNIIPRKQAETEISEPRRVGDKIVFFCPNGDKIVVPAKLAGKRGLCTKCKVAVVIPAVGMREQDEPEPVLEVPGLQVEPESEPEPAAGEPPAVSESAAAPVPPPPAEPAAEWSFGGDAEASHAGLDTGPPGAAEAAWTMPPLPDAGSAPEHPAARLVARLWVERDHHGGVVELHLSGGSVILPEWYEPNWSRGTHGLFASQAVDGSVTLTAVAWDTIEKIVVRQVQGLPDGMFE